MCKKIRMDIVLCKVTYGYSLLLETVFYNVKYHTVCNTPEKYIKTYMHEL